VFHKSSLKTWAFFILTIIGNVHIYTNMKLSVCQICGEAYDYTGYPNCPECIKDGDTTKKDKEIPKLLQERYNQNAIHIKQQHKLFEAAAHDPNSS
jgi:hypothetical protein